MNMVKEKEAAEREKGQDLQMITNISNNKYFVLKLFKHFSPACYSFDDDRSFIAQTYT